MPPVRLIPSPCASHEREEGEQKGAWWQCADAGRLRHGRRVSQGVPAFVIYDGRLAVAVGHGIVVRESTPLAPLRIVLPSPTAGQQFDILVQGRRVQFQPRSHGWQSMSCHDAHVHT